MKISLIGQSRHFPLSHPCGAYVANGDGCHRQIAQEVKKIVVREQGTILPEATNLDPYFAIGHVDEGPLEDLLIRFFDQRYPGWDRFCRAAYEEELPAWVSPVVPWDQILAQRSRWWRPVVAAPSPAAPASL